MVWTQGAVGSTHAHLALVSLLRLPVSHPGGHPLTLTSCLFALQSQYSAEDCAFEEEIRPDGYNVYWSKKHHLPVSLSSARQRQLFKSRGFLPLSHFLPMLSTIPTEPDEIQDHLKPDLFALPLKTDSMDPFGLATNLGVVKSPSFYK